MRVDDAEFEENEIYAVDIVTSTGEGKPKMLDEKHCVVFYYFTLRFKCVCKQWHSLISSPEFIKLHLNKSLKTNSNNLLILSTMFSLSYIELDNPSHPILLENIPRNPKRKETLKVLGTCNGLLCVYDWGKICLYNPSTHLLRVIQEYKADCFGFGYDSVGNDYKILAMKKQQSPRSNVTGITSSSTVVIVDTKIFSLRGNSWEKGPDFCYDLVGNQKYAKFTNNALHWLVDLSELGKRVVAFELHDETYNMLSLPDLGGMKDCELGLWVLGGELCLQVEYCVLGKYNIDVWVMKEYGVQESWKKLFRFPYEDVLGSGVSMKALAYSKGGRKVLLEQDSKYFWHELEGKMMSASLGVSGCYAAEVCAGSLVSGDEMLKLEPKWSNRVEQAGDEMLIEQVFNTGLEDID